MSLFSDSRAIYRSINRHFDSGKYEERHGGHIILTINLSSGIVWSAAVQR